MENPHGIQSQNHRSTLHLSSSSSSSSFSGGSSVLSESSCSVSLKHNPGISTDWTPEEQMILEDGLNYYSTESTLIRYAKIAVLLENKTVRDIALRCRWMTKKESTKRRKQDSLVRKIKDKKIYNTDSSAKASRFVADPNVPPYRTSMILSSYDDEISYKGIGGLIGELLEQNALAFRKVTENFLTLKLDENITLLAQARDNFLRITNEMNHASKIMNQMPPLPFKINEELANAILPSVPHYVSCQRQRNS